MNKEKRELPSFHRKRKKRVLFLLAGVIVVLLIGMVAYVVVMNQRRAVHIGYREDGQTVTRPVGNGITKNGKTYVYNDHLSNFLFMGVDYWDTVSSITSREDAGRADAIFLVSYDRALETARILIIPRDTITEIETFNPMGRSLGLSEDHLNIQYTFGDGKNGSCELMKTAVSKLLNGISIQGYCALHMGGMGALADAVDGVEVVLPDDSLADLGDEYKKGSTILITGENAETFLRRRDITETQSAIVRQDRQKVFLDAYIAKAKEISDQNASIVTKIYDSVQSYLITNMGNDLFAKLLTASQLPTQTVPGTGTQGQLYDEYYVDHDGLDDLILELFYREA